MKKFLVLFALLYAPVVFADDDITIMADDKVEWHNKEGKMVAIGNARASNSSMSVNAQKLEGFYEEVGDEKEISKVLGYGDVVLVSENAKGYGEKLFYDVKKDEAILSGAPAMIKTGTETLKASENIYYYPTKKKAIARGKVEAETNDGNKIFADEMIAYFKQSNNSSLSLEKVDIFDNVKIITKDATVNAEKGVYYPQSGEVELFEDVSIIQGDNVLRGDKAVANLNTGVSKLIAGSKGRVKGTFKAKE